MSARTASPTRRRVSQSNLKTILRPEVLLEALTELRNDTMLTTVTVRSQRPPITSEGRRRPAESGRGHGLPVIFSPRKPFAQHAVLPETRSQSTLRVPPAREAFQAFPSQLSRVSCVGMSDWPQWLSPRTFQGQKIPHPTNHISTANLEWFRARGKQRLLLSQVPTALQVITQEQGLPNLIFHCTEGASLGVLAVCLLAKCACLSTHGRNPTLGLPYPCCHSKGLKPKPKHTWLWALHLTSDKVQCFAALHSQQSTRYTQKNRNETFVSFNIL